jgi:hypothetical protein
MTFTIRVVYVVLAWLFAVGVVAQAYFAGLSLFGYPAGLQLHSGVGWLMALDAILLLVLVFLGRFPRRVVVHTVVLFALMFLQVSLVTYLRAFQQPLLTAIHPANAVLLFGVSTMAAIRATAALRGRQQVSKAVAVPA